MGLTWPDVLARLTRGESLTEDEAEATLGAAASGVSGVAHSLQKRSPGS